MPKNLNPKFVIETLADLLTDNPGVQDWLNPETITWLCQHPDEFDAIINDLTTSTTGSEVEIVHLSSRANSAYAPEVLGLYRTSIDSTWNLQDILGPDKQTWTALIGDTVVGAYTQFDSFTSQLGNAPLPYLAARAVEPRYRGRGIGGILLDDFLTQMPENETWFVRVERNKTGVIDEHKRRCPLVNEGYVGGGRYLEMVFKNLRLDRGS